MHEGLCRKVKWSRYRPGVAQRVGRSVALFFHDGGTRRGRVVSSTPRPHFTPGKDPVPILQEAGWAPGPVWKGGKSRPHRDSIPKTYLNLWKYVAEFLLEWEIFQTKYCIEDQITHLCSIAVFPENRAVCEIMWKNIVEPDRLHMKTQYSTCALHFGYLRLQTHIQNMQFLSLFHCNSGYVNAPPRYVYTYIAMLVTPHNTNLGNKNVANEEPFRCGLRSAGIRLCHYVIGSRLERTEWCCIQG